MSDNSQWWLNPQRRYPLDNNAEQPVSPQQGGYYSPPSEDKTVTLSNTDETLPPLSSGPSQPTPPSAAETSQFPRVSSDTDTDSWARSSAAQRAQYPPQQYQQPQQQYQQQQQYADDGYAAGGYGAGAATGAAAGGAVATPVAYPAQAPQQESSRKGLFAAVAAFFVVFIIFSGLFFANAVGLISVPFLGQSSNESANSAQEQNREGSPETQGQNSSNDAAPSSAAEVARSTAPLLPPTAVPANDSAMNNGPAGHFNNAYLGSSVTSAAFASEVQKSFYSHYQLTKSTDATLHVVSPVTNQLYEMRCADNKLQYVICTGGNNAVVYIS